MSSKVLTDESFDSNENTEGDGDDTESDADDDDDDGGGGGDGESLYSKCNSLDSECDKKANSDDSECEDELPDTSISILDKKLDSVSIIKIDTNHPGLSETGVSITDANHLQLAERIVKKIVGVKRKNNDIAPGPRTKKPRRDSKPTDVHASARKVVEVQLKPQIKRILNEKSIFYYLKLYLVEAKQESSYSKTFADLVTEKSRERLCKEMAVSKSYLLLFYRNVPETSRKTKGSSYRPEIFAVTTASARWIVSRYADKDFTKLIEKRTLRFPLQKITTKPDRGLIAKETKSARPGSEIIFTFWDFLENFVGSRIRYIRENSSLYAIPLDAFLTKDGKQKKSKFHISEKSMRIMCKLNIPQLGSVLDHFSSICRRGKTYITNTYDEEEDDPKFEMQEFMVSVTDKELLQQLNEHLYKELEKYMEGEKSHIFLNHKSTRTWMLAEEFGLYARTDTEQMAQRLNRKKICTWYEYPSLDEILKCLKVKCSNKFKEEWLHDAIITFRSIRAPLKKCIFSRFGNADIGTYIYSHGDWIEIKAQYLYQIERDFVEKMSAHVLESSQLPLLLPWKYPGENREKAFKVNTFEKKQMNLKWKKHYQKVCGRDHFDKVLVKLENLTKKHTDMHLNFEKLGKMKAQKKAAHLYRLLECDLNEDDYNAAHTLLNMILPDNSKRHVITCDRKTPHGIELCDILMYNDKTTYLVHVKEKFEGSSIREVCSQIRNAADNIYRNRTASNGTGIIDKYWKMLTEDAKSSKTHENEVKKCLEHMSQAKFKELFHPPREIVFVLACRDKRKDIDFSQDIPFSSEQVDDVRGKIRNKFSDQDSSLIIERLIGENYLTDQGTPTNKFILEGKARKLDRKSFLDTLKSWEVIGNSDNAKFVHGVLLSVLPKSESTIAKMEIIRLVQAFQRYADEKEKFHLKIHNICKDF